MASPLHLPQSTLTDRPRWAPVCSELCEPGCQPSRVELENTNSRGEHGLQAHLGSTEVCQMFLSHLQASENITERDSSPSLLNYASYHLFSLWLISSVSTGEITGFAIDFSSLWLSVSQLLNNHHTKSPYPNVRVRIKKHVKYLPPLASANDWLQRLRLLALEILLKGGCLEKITTDAFDSDQQANWWC